MAFAEDEEPLDFGSILELEDLDGLDLDCDADAAAFSVAEDNWAAVKDIRGAPLPLETPPPEAEDDDSTLIRLDGLCCPAVVGEELLDVADEDSLVFVGDEDDATDAVGSSNDRIFAVNNLRNCLRPFLLNVTK